MSFLLHWLKTRDTLGSKVGFTINSNDTHQTVCGGINSLFLTILYIYFFFIFAQDMYNKENPVGFDQKQANTEEFSKLKFKNGTFLSGFSIIDWNENHYKLEDYFFPIFDYKEIEVDNKTKTQKSTITKLDTIRCNENYIHKNISIGKVELEKYFCPDLTKIGHKKLYGDFNDLKLSYVSFRLSLCNRNKTICKDVNKVWDLFEKNEVFISVVYPKIDYFISFKDNPFNVKLHHHYTYLSNLFFLMEEFTFQRNQLDEDVGGLFENKKTHSFEGIHKVLPLVDPRGKELLKKNLKEEHMHRYENYYFTEMFYDKNMKYHYRQYLKLPDIFANVGGMMDFISMFIIFIMSYYGKWRLDSYLCQRLIYIENEDGKNFEGKCFRYTKSEIQDYKKNLRNFIKFRKNIDFKKNEEFDNSLMISENYNNQINNYDNYNNHGKHRSSKDLTNIVIYPDLSDNKNNLNNSNENPNKINFNNKFRTETNNNMDISKKIEMSDINILPKNSVNNYNQILGNINNINEIRDDDDMSPKKIIKENNNNGGKNFLNENYLNGNVDDNKLIKMKNYLETTIYKFREFKNELEFKLHNYFIYIFFPKNKKDLRPNYDTINNYCEKIYEKFDIFYYMDELKKSEFIRNSMFDEKQKKLFDLLCKKFYRISLDSEEEKPEDIENINKEILNYVMNNESEINRIDKNMINAFIN